MCNLTSSRVQICHPNKKTKKLLLTFFSLPSPLAFEQKRMRTILNWMMAACAGCNLLFLLTLMKREAPHRVVEVVTLVEYPDITAEEKTLPAVIEQRIDAEMVGERIREMQGICTEYDQDLCRRSLGYLGDFYSNFTKRTVKELPLWKTEFKIRSQNGEDGILWYLFSVLGVSNKKAIEISVQDGTECNTANLVLRGGWEVLMFDGSKENRERGLKFYKSFKDERITVPRFVAAWITIDSKLFWGVCDLFF